jgi:hypothetical protein
MGKLSARRARAIFARIACEYRLPAVRSFLGFGRGPKDLLPLHKLKMPHGPNETLAEQDRCDCPVRPASQQLLNHRMIFGPLTPQIMTAAKNLKEFV